MMINSLDEPSLDRPITRYGGPESIATVFFFGQAFLPREILYISRKIYSKPSITH